MIRSSASGNEQPGPPGSGASKPAPAGQMPSGACLDGLKPKGPRRVRSGPFVGGNRGAPERWAQQRSPANTALPSSRVVCHRIRRPLWTMPTLPHLLTQRGTSARVPASSSDKSVVNQWEPPDDSQTSGTESRLRRDYGTSLPP